MQVPSLKIQFWFDKHLHVKQCRFGGLLEAFDPEQMTPQGLRRHCDSVQIAFHGYQRERRLPFLVPEVRTFLQELRGAWPYAPYFCDLGNSFLGIEAIASIENLAVVEKQGVSEFYLRFDTNELRRYLSESHRVIQRLGHQAGMTPLQIRERKTRFDDYIAARLEAVHKG